MPRFFVSHRRSLLMVIGLLLAAAAYLLYPRPPVNHYLTATVSNMDLEDTVLATGTIKALREVSVGAQVSGQVKSLKVVLGQSVKKGDLLAEIDPRTQENSLEDAQASVSSYQSQLKSKLAALLKARQDFARQQQMLGQQATSQESYDSAKATLDGANADAEQLQAQLQQARISLKTAQLNLGYTRILAPIDGVVVALPVEEGQTVNASQSTPTMVKLAQLDTVTVKAEISEGDVVRVKPGLPVYFTILGEPDRRYQARLRAIDPAPQSYSDSSDSTSTSTSTSTSSSSSSSTAIYYYGLFDVPNPGHRLRINMTAQVSVVLTQAHAVLAIPANALGVRGKDGRYQVRVLQPDGRVQPRQISIGLNNNVHAQVLAGLRAGEQVIVGEASATASTSSGHNGPPPMGM
ncbi:efflux RND transporter periplasmic adaptor subunit [Aquitalea sp. LB_tupeE]|uniref:efflux RND transporter periplasmic adaptor subunit n=1 Tax=Aquitalea sp. LB_tupeE TaxID=2748078 RepID=UPI0015BA71B2|nr:efflux RND transporter periplasmic adaptor subunit [Aquitalea sp. LB_tupeE]NWK79679.1 efflux RND transporter periplasmic adaptor subunit [Aquitalea sp. LB_tupeE]